MTLRDKGLHKFTFCRAYSGTEKAKKYAVIYDTTDMVDSRVIARTNGEEYLTDYVAANLSNAVARFEADYPRWKLAKLTVNNRTKGF